MIHIKNVYIVLTEYQYLQSVNLSTSEYSSTKYLNVIYIVRNGRRLMGIDASKDWRIDNLQVHILDNKKPKEIVELIMDENPDHFFIFQGNSPVNVFLGTTLSKNGIEVSLGPDGLASYNIYNKKKHRLLSLLKNTVLANIFLLKNKLFNGRVLVFDYYKYGSHKFIDNIWVTHPEQYIHQSTNKVDLIRLPDFNDKCIEFIKKCFDFDESFPTADVIYYFNQPFPPELVEQELDFLKAVLDNFPDRRLLVKLHPLTSEKMKSLYGAIKRLEIIESSVPAEVMVISLKNCILFTGWSSVLMLENNSCNYYFNFPIYNITNIKSLNQSERIVLSHIKLIDKPELMKFPNE